MSVKLVVPQSRIASISIPQTIARYARKRGVTTRALAENVLLLAAEAHKTRRRLSVRPAAVIELPETLAVRVWLKALAEGIIKDSSPSARIERLIREEATAFGLLNGGAK